MNNAKKREYEIHARFSLGQIAVTSGIMAAIEEDDSMAVHVMKCLSRHASGDWGKVCKEDAAENEISLKHGFRIMSNYEGEGFRKIWIITEADRSVTTVLFPDEY
jgi:hypothetical protein